MEKSLEPISVTTHWSPADYEQLTRVASRRGMTIGDMAAHYTRAHLRALATSQTRLDTFFRLLRQRLDADPSLLDSHHPEFIGELRSGRALLLPQPSIDAARQAADPVGLEFEVSVAMLSSLMLERGLLEQSDTKAQALRRLAGKLRRVWSIPSEILTASDGVIAPQQP